MINNKDKIEKILNHSEQDKKTLQELQITDNEMDILYRMGLGVLPPSVFSFFIPSLFFWGGGVTYKLTLNLLESPKSLVFGFRS
ncbi:hypothetical protein ID1017_02380 [Helicobacter pylori]